MRARAVCVVLLVACGGDRDVDGPPVANALRFSDISAGYYHTCGLAANGNVFCWGNNDFGTLGDGSRTTRTSPTPVARGLTYTSVDAGAGHNCALSPNGIAECWGQNDEGQVGDGSFVPRDRPIAVTGNLTFKSVTAGHAHSCGVTAAGVGYCWGDNTRGQLGAGAEAPTKSATPLRVSFEGAFTQVIAGYYQTCALTASGEAYCWGLNSSSQNGDSTTVDRNVPVRAQRNRTFTSISPGDRFVCGISAGLEYCWGQNRPGLLLNGHPMQRVFTSAGESTIQDAQSYACGVNAEQRVICWGGAIRALRAAGSTTQTLHPTLRFTAAAAGAMHVCALSEGGYAYCGGANYTGQLGDATRTDRSTLVPVSAPVSNTP